MVNEMVAKREKSSINGINNGSLVFLYHTAVGRMFLKVLINPAISKMAGWFMDSRISAVMIRHFIKKNNIDVSEYEERKYISYNDFFTRKINDTSRKIDMKKNSLIAPCDSKLTAYKINDKSIFKIKDSYYRVEDLLKDDKLAKKYRDGYCLIFRLSVDDYHRYCYIDNGSKKENKYIKGVLHTVRPIALENYNIYKRNAREYTVLKTENFGEVVQVEVGAIMIGRIKNYHQEYNFTKGEEKGMFEFGGSTIVLLIEKNRVDIDQEILKNTENNYETIVKLGTKIGTKKAR